MAVRRVSPCGTKGKFVDGARAASCRGRRPETGVAIAARGLGRRGSPSRPARPRLGPKPPLVIGRRSRRAGRIQDFAMPSRAGARPSGADPDAQAPAARRRADPGDDSRGAGKAALNAAGAWRSSRRGTASIGVVVGADVLAVEAQARPPGAACRARPARPGATLRLRRAACRADPLGVITVGDRDLEAVFAGIARARDRNAAIAIDHERRRRS